MALETLQLKYSDNFKQNEILENIHSAQHACKCRHFEARIRNSDLFLNFVKIIQETTSLNKRL